MPYNQIWSTSYLKNMYLLLQVKWVFLLLGGSIAQSNTNSFPLRCQGGSQSHSHEKLILFHWNLTCENWKWTKWRSADKITNMQLHQEFRLEPLLPKNHSITKHLPSEEISYPVLTGAVYYCFAEICKAFPWKRHHLDESISSSKTCLYLWAVTVTFQMCKPLDCKSLLVFLNIFEYFNNLLPKKLVSFQFHLLF